MKYLTLLLVLFSISQAQPDSNFQTVEFESGFKMDWRAIDNDGNNYPAFALGGQFGYHGGEVFGLISNAYIKNLGFVRAQYGSTWQVDATVFLFNMSKTATKSINMHQSSGYNVNYLHVVDAPVTGAIHHGPHLGFSPRKYVDVFGDTYSTWRFNELAIGWSMVRAWNIKIEKKIGNKFEYMRRTSLTQFTLDAVIPLNEPKVFDENEAPTTKTLPLGVQAEWNHRMGLAKVWFDLRAGAGYNIANSWNTILGFGFGFAP